MIGSSGKRVDLIGNRADDGNREPPVRVTDSWEPVPPIEIFLVAVRGREPAVGQGLARAVGWDDLAGRDGQG
jgi:hypothetical protein